MDRLVLILLGPILLGLSPVLAQPQAPGSEAAADSSVAISSTTDDDPTWSRRGTTVRAHADDYVGAADGHGVLYDRESAVYRAGPPIRYNRVEGLVVGFERDPLALGDEDQTRVFGQAAYATALRDVRYTIGVESQLYQSGPTGLKLGVLYQEQTLARDRWKTSALENSLASGGVRSDFFDYYEAQGATIYGVQDLPHTLQLTVGVRNEIHRPRPVQTNWSLFGNGSFRANPAVDAGRVQSVVASLTGGRVRDLDDLPTGQAARLEATVGEGPNGTPFSRYEADGRVYLPSTHDTRLALRLRGGYATHDTPLQSRFTLGGVGSVRSYDQNAFAGTRMLLANAEYIVDGATIIDGLLEDLFVAGLADAGWVGGPDTPFRVEDVRPSAGFSVGLDERRVRLDVTWPLRSGPGTGSSPSIWLRVAPSF